MDNKPTTRTGEISRDRITASERRGALHELDEMAVLIASLPDGRTKHVLHTRAVNLVRLCDRAIVFTDDPNAKIYTPHDDLHERASGR